MKLCHPDAEIFEYWQGDLRIRCLRQREPADVAPLWRHVEPPRLWTLITANVRIQLPERPRGLSPPESALLRAAVKLGAELLVNVMPPVCVKRLFTKRCHPPKAQYVAEGVASEEEAYKAVEGAKAQLGQIHSLAYVGRWIVLAWTPTWQDRWGL
jgi:hypothetical protein